MKPTIFIVVLILLIAITSCCKKDIADCNPSNTVCSEKVPTNELCSAQFNRWFYDKSTNSCKEISYSGCNPKGFATKQECEACKCM